MPVFTRDVPQQLGVATTGPAEQVNPYSSLGNVAVSVGREFAQSAAQNAKAAKESGTAELLLETNSILNNIEAGTVDKTVEAVVGSMSRRDRALSQLSPRQSDMTQLLESNAINMQYQKALLQGNLEAATKIRELSNWRGVKADAGNEIITRGEIKAEQLQNKLDEISIGALRDNGYVQLANWYGDNDPEHQKQIAETLAKIDRSVQNKISMETVKRDIEAQQSQLNLDKSVRENQNRESLLPEAQKALYEAGVLVRGAIQRSLAIPLAGADPELVAAQKRQEEQKWQDLINRIIGFRKEGIQGDIDKIIEQLRIMQSDAITASTGVDAAKQMQLAYDYTKNKDFVSQPDETRKALQMLPLVNSISNLYATGGVGQDTYLRATSFMDTASRMLEGSVPVSLATITTNEQNKEMMKGIKDLVAKNLGKLDVEKDAKTITGVMAYVAGASNDYATIQLSDRVKYGDFITSVLSAKRAVDAFKSYPQFDSPRNISSINMAVSSYKADIDRMKDYDMKNKAASTTILGKPVKYSELIQEVPTKDGGVTFVPRTDLDSRFPGGMAIIPARQAAAEMDGRYRPVYKKISETQDNLGTAVKVEESSAAQPEQSVQEPSGGVSQEDKKLLDLLKGLSKEDREYLVQAITPAQ